MLADRPAYSTSPILNVFDCIEHGFFGRFGGVSEDIYEGLNCGFSSDDQSQSVLKNRSRVARCFGLKADDLYSLKQAHTNRVIKITQRLGEQYEVLADGMVSVDCELGLGVLGADCAPVLLADPVNRVIGAAHSGWKGALDGISEAVINRMLGLGAELHHIRAAIGPAMQQQHYEVKLPFKQHFEKQSAIEASCFFNQRQHRLYFDTPAYIEARLREAGVEHIERSAEDTFSQPQKYFSYRRSCQHGERDYGRQISVILLKP